MENVRPGDSTYNIVACRPMLKQKHVLDLNDPKEGFFTRKHETYLRGTKLVSE